MDKKVIKVEISHKTIFFAAAFIAAIWFIIQVKEIIIILFLSVILVTALVKPVEWLNSKRIPRVIAVLIVYILILTFIGIGIGIIIPPLIEQTTALSSRTPQIISTINNFFSFAHIPVEDVSTVLARQIQQFAGNIVSITTVIFSSILLVLTVFVLAFYILMDWNRYQRILASPFSGRQEKKAASVINKIESGLGKWVRGQIALSFIVGAMTFLGLTILGIPYALPLSLVAGILEIIPIIGPIISAIPAMLVGLTVSPSMALGVAALFILVQQLENHLIVPTIMSKVIGLQPPVIILALLIGAKVAGIGGAFLAPPILIILKIIFDEFLKEDQEIKESLEEN